MEISRERLEWLLRQSRLAKTAGEHEWYQLEAWRVGAALYAYENEDRLRAERERKRRFG